MRACAWCDEKQKSRGSRRCIFTLLHLSYGVWTVPGAPAAHSHAPAAKLAHCCNAIGQHEPGQCIDKRGAGHFSPSELHWCDYVIAWCYLGAWC